MEQIFGGIKLKFKIKIYSGMQLKGVVAPFSGNRLLVVSIIKPVSLNARCSGKIKKNPPLELLLNFRFCYILDFIFFNASKYHTFIHAISINCKVYEKLKSSKKEKNNNF